MALPLDKQRSEGSMKLVQGIQLMELLESTNKTPTMTVESKPELCSSPSNPMSLSYLYLKGHMYRHSLKHFEWY